jgi:hypothetical protein
VVRWGIPRDDRPVPFGAWAAPIVAALLVIAALAWSVIT